MLTRRGARALRAIVLFSFISWLSGYPIFTIASLTLILLILLENIQVKNALGALEKLRIERLITKYKLEVGGTADVKLRFSNPTNRTSGTLIIEDRVPNAFDITSGSSTSTLRIKGNKETTLSYSLRAIQIGDYEIDDLSITLTDSLGFINYIEHPPVRSKLEVYPRLRLMKDMRVRGVTHTLQAKSIGQRAVNKSGLGLDFHGIREYSPGDDFKHIAWKAVAKSTRNSLMTREFEADRSLNLVFAIQAKESFLDGLVGQRKLDYAVEAVAAIAYAASLEGDKAILAVGNHCHPLTIPGQSKQRQLLRILKSTYNIQPSSEWDLQTLAECLLRNVRQWALIFIITDSESHDPYEFKTLGQLLQRYSVQVIAVRTISLLTKPNLKDSLVKTGYDVVATHERRILDQIAQNCWRLGVPVKKCNPNELSRTLFRSYLAAKKGGTIMA